MLCAFAWWSSQGEPAGIPSRTREHPEARADDRDVAPVASPPESPSSPESPSLPPTSSASGPLAGAVDPCGSGEDDPPVERPSMNELLQLRIAELNDRMQLARSSSATASPALRRGWQAAMDPARGDEALSVLSRAPDRVDDGFDHYVAVAIVLAANALHAGDALRAARLSELAANAAPDDALPLLLGALAHEARGEHTVARDLFVRAFAIDGEEPAVAYAVAWRIENGADVPAALRAFDAYLAAVPGDREMARRRARLQIRRAEFADAITYVRGGVRLVVMPSFDHDAAIHILDVVDAGLVRGASLLGIPRRDELTIFVHVDAPAMRRATCVQEWAGAVYDGALETDAATAVSPAADVSLTHESFHAAVHPAVPNVPTWLDEGLAQYASGEEGPAHLRSYELMLREHTWIPFASMNDAFLVIDDSSDAGLAYHQALAMVDWLVERRGERGIRDAASWLIGGGDPTRVLAEAARGELDGEALLAFVSRHVASLHARGHAAAP